MVGASRLKRWLWLAAFALFAAGAWQVVRIREASRFNAAVRADRLAAAAELDAPEGDFAAALILQRKGAFVAERAAERGGPVQPRQLVSAPGAGSGRIGWG